jgi:hypothetical protein
MVDLVPQVSGIVGTAQSINVVRMENGLIRKSAASHIDFMRMCLHRSSPNAGSVCGDRPIITD